MEKMNINKFSGKNDIPQPIFPLHNFITFPSQANVAKSLDWNDNEVEENFKANEKCLS